jgi:crotonobetainyl-CoA:carnitine CoA-transferase CaiB-like acyl-CoA transferase
MGAKNNPILIEWMKSDGIDVDEIKDIKWAELDMLDFSKEKRSRMVEIIQQFFLRHTKKELYDESTKRRLLLYPVSTIEDLAHDPQLEFRNFWEKLDQPDLNTTITYPHQCALVSGFNAKITSPPPRIGEHNIPIFSSIGISRGQMNALQEKGVI